MKISNWCDPTQGIGIGMGWKDTGNQQSLQCRTARQERRSTSPYSDNWWEGNSKRNNLKSVDHTENLLREIPT